MSSSWNNDLFVERLQHLPGGPWTLFEAQQQLDQLVLQPLSENTSSLDDGLFLDFLSDITHRRLVQCFLGNQTIHQWSIEDLHKQTRPRSPQALAEALEQCHSWQIAVESTDKQAWQGHPRLVRLNNIGWTFEWIIQTLLEKHYGALVRRHVVLGELSNLGELDILALLPDGRAILCECKSSSKRLTDRQLDRFFAKARALPAAQSILVIDSDDLHQMQQRLGQLGQATLRAFGNISIGAIQRFSGSSIVQLNEHLSVADTGGGILTSLRAVLGEYSGA